MLPEAARNTNATGHERSEQTAALGSASGVVPGRDALRHHAQEREAPDLLREPAEPVARKERAVLLVPGGDRTPHRGVLGGEGLGEALEHDAGDLDPAPPDVDRDRHPG